MQIVLEPVNRLRKDPLVCRFTRVHPLFELGKKGDIFIPAYSIVIVWSKYITAGTTLKAGCSGEGANKQVISSQADSLIKISRIWADFFPANTSN
ncbi:hypothetical protein LCD39_07160 [Enterobacter asburiae]|uniref:hypothetical protein n=1 Tax=Enterobacter asburiae TaxID=61645 RepID=UPI001FF5BBC3|nr:hypothetical protein [Enterobacter asburiae]UOZ19775.1 hypothetical protein LCD39_07160 [Enterobacter asburiae]